MSTLYMYIYVCNKLDDTFNSIHGRNFLKKKLSGEIAHGMLTGSLFSSLISKSFELPIYLSQSLEFISPVYINENLFVVISFTSHQKKVTYICLLYTSPSPRD